LGPQSVNLTIGDLGRSPIVSTGATAMSHEVLPGLPGNGTMPGIAPMLPWASLAIVVSFNELGHDARAKFSFS
jgi:hypothetical protein